MVYRRFRKFRKTYTKKQRSRPFKKRYGTRIKNNRTIHYFKRTFIQEVVLGTDNFKAITSGNVGEYNQFKLSQLPNYTDFTNLYDSYKICGIARKYVYDRNSSCAYTSISPVEATLPTLITVNDWNDTNALASVNSALEYSSCKISRLDKVVKRYFRPTQDVGSYQITKSRWNSTDQVNVVHMGLKEACDTNTVTEYGAIKIFTTFYLACRTSK